MAFVRGGHRAIIKGLDRRKVMLVPAGSQMSTAPSSRPPKEDGNKTSDTGPGGSGKLIGIGAILAIGGLGYAYYKHGDDEMIRSKVNMIKGSVGLFKPSAITNGSQMLSSESQANCVGKNDSESKGKESGSLRKTGNGTLLANDNAASDVKPRVVEATGVALKAYYEATELIKKFMERAYFAIEKENLESPDFEQVWSEVYDLSVKRCDKVKDAMNKGQRAWELICQLREIVDKGNSSDPLLISAKETLLSTEREVLNAKAKMDCTQSESKLVEQYRNLVEDFRRRLKNEVDSLLTGDKDSRTTLTENEYTMVLTHAYKKLMRTQMELSECQAKSFSLGLEGIPNRGVLGMKLETMKEYYEGELIKALSRQNILYQENFELAKQVLQNEFATQLKEKDGLMQARHLDDLVNIYKRASEATDAVKLTLTEQRSNAFRSDKLRKLWAYCNTLYSRINFVDNSEYNAVKIDKDQLLAEFSGDEFVVQLLHTIPTIVESTQSLKGRFFNTIDITCRKLATFKNDEQFTLWKYAVGSVQAILTSRCDGENTTPKSVYELLDRTAYHLRRGELLDAVSTLNKLEGIPREVCRDWLLDARLALEANQTLFALMIHADSTNLQP